MKNSEMPIHPIFNENGFATHQSNIRIGSISGLTKREWFIGMALSGFSADPGMTPDGIASASIRIADRILELIEEKED